MRSTRLFLFLTGVLPTLFGCSSTPPEIGCVIPPPNLATTDRAIAVDIAATLNALPKGGSIESDFRDVVAVQFDRLSEPTACLYLFFKAIECYAKEEGISRKLRDRLIDIAREEWRRSCGLQGTPHEFTPSEMRVLSDSRYGNLTMKTAREIGFR